MRKRPTTPPALTPEDLVRRVHAHDVDALSRLVQDPSIPASAWRVTDPNPYAHDPLLVSALAGPPSLMPVLLKVCDPNETTSFGDTPLMVAALHGRVSAFDVLLPVSDPSCQNKAGQTALMLAIEGIGGPNHADHLACVERLIPVSDLRAEDDHGMTALRIVVSHARAALGQDTTPYWECADRLALGADRADALRAHQQAPDNAMPRFTALLEQEALLASATEPLPHPAGPARSAQRPH